MVGESPKEVARERGTANQYIPPRVQYPLEAEAEIGLTAIADWQ